MREFKLDKIKVFVTGASGNVGSTIVRTIQTKDGFELVGGWGKESGQDLGVLAGIRPLGIKITADLEAGLNQAKPDVVIDFSATPVLKSNFAAYLKHNLNAVIGTTGLSEDDLEPFKAEVATRGLRWAVIPNFGLGINLVSEFIKKARQFYPYITITDQHTHKMANAPSGTAAALAAAADTGKPGEVSSRETYPGVLGATIAGVPVHSQRLPWPGPYSGHEITLARQDEIIKISVQDFTSDIYMDGVFLTAEKISSFPAGSFLRSLAEVMK